jgi:hypothetical protein
MRPEEIMTDEMKHLYSRVIESLDEIDWDYYINELFKLYGVLFEIEKVEGKVDNYTISKLEKFQYDCQKQTVLEFTIDHPLWRDFLANTFYMLIIGFAYGHLTGFDRGFNEVTNFDCSEGFK